jgi:16S rRNA (cytidine1402-2'-O)-methyltransferase
MDTGLYLVPTPIGNLSDITLRAIEVLKNVDLILAEDTRTSGKLLKHYSIQTPMQSFHAHNEHKRVSHFANEIKNGKKIALISDAGTPGISDPGFLLARECLSLNINIESLPGATAFVPALIKSGLPNDRFVFEGFLPHKKGRNTRLSELSNEGRTMIFYESPHRLLKTLHQFIEFFGKERAASVSRELTKKFEETKNGNLSELVDYFEMQPPKGEFVIVVSGKSKK